MKGGFIHVAALRRHLQVPCVSKLSSAQAGPAMTLGSQLKPRLDARRTELSALFLAEMVGSRALGLGDDPADAEGPWTRRTPRPLAGCHRCQEDLVTLRITRSWQYCTWEESSDASLYRSVFLLSKAQA